MSIVTLTLNPAIDMNCSVKRVVPDDKLRTSRPRLEPGGGGINVCRTVHELGGLATALWTKGGFSGQYLQHLLDELGVAHEPISIEGETRQNLNVAEESSERQFRFVSPGPELDSDAAQRCLDSVEQTVQVPGFLVISGSLPTGLPDDFYTDVVQRCPSGCRVVVDTSGLPLAKAVEADLFLIKPNIRELSQLAGRELGNDDEIVATARQLIETGKVEVVVVSLGAGGAILVTGDNAENFRSPTVPVRSKIGAGDSMTGGIVMSLSRGDGHRDAVRFGVAAGATAVMTAGTTLCSREDVERLYERMR